MDFVSMSAPPNPALPFCLARARGPPGGRFYTQGQRRARAWRGPIIESNRLCVGKHPDAAPGERQISASWGPRTDLLSNCLTFSAPAAFAHCLRRAEFLPCSQVLGLHGGCSQRPRGARRSVSGDIGRSLGEGGKETRQLPE